MKLVTDTHTLEDVISTLSKSDFVTVDTEFIRESTYWPELCLIQLASPDIAVIVDPLSPEIDLSPLFKLMANTNVVKVFHAARQDVEIIYKLGNIIPTPLFDTQIAGSVCGFGESVSYEQIVERITGEHIDKSSRYTDWSRRPLSDKQLSYALADVTHLRDVYKYLEEKLDKNGRTHWIDDEMSILTSPKTYIMPNDEAWKRIKGRIRKPRELAVLQQVAAWREQEAKNRNVPRGRILKDECLVEIAIQHPKDEMALSRLRSIPKGWEHSGSAAELLKAVQKGLSVELDNLPAIHKHVATGNGTAAAIELLRVLLKLVADEEDIAPRIIANNDELEKIAKQDHLDTLSAMQGWRYNIFGKKAEKMLNGHLGFYFHNGKILTKEL
ncbi:MULTISPECIES: ribonuclease D [Bartonella]|uniref:ribonuclease D n=1 Tax=Bartonella TaxID=773 RepID=UPI0018DB7CC6|nr:MULTISPECIES: ribonuclease D [Bartonella]MBH9975470.1 ribonuclease D [Bartonella choladocola]MBI0015077.1 ribonuclease D [Bartonella sp. B10834G3]